MDVAFAVMPFADASRPAIGVSLLQAALGERGFSSRIHYLNVMLAEELGVPLYSSLANAFPASSLVGEWFFADLLYGDAVPDEQVYVARVLGKYARGADEIAKIVAARAGRRSFVARCVDAIMADEPRLVGFTTTFHQTCACLAVARRLKELPDPPTIVFGGANCEGEMGLQMIRSFPEIDYVCTQEGDYAFPMFVERLLREGDPRAVPGIARRGESAELVPPPRVDDMDSLPIPTYHDYFGAIARSPLLPELDPGAQIETSRGCWWGEKHHCTFCGLNGATMQFRSKSPERAFSELVHLTKTYGVTRVDCVDNILDLRYVQTLFPTIVERELKVELFYETKANLKFPQLVTMRDAGVSAIQPGLESLSNDILRRMRKGCTGLQNICLLRWCSELGMAVAWNIIFGFPDEPPAEYDRMAELMPLLWHLQPPASCSPFRLDRFSPYHDAAEEFGLRRVRPTAAAYYVFPFGRRELERLSYFFDFDYEDDRDPRSYAGGLLREFDRWWAAHSGPEEARPRLDAFVSGERVHVVDTRACASQAEHELAGLEAEIYRRCDMPHSAASLARAFGSAGDVATVERALARLVDAKLTIEMEGQYLSLAVVRDRAPLTDGGPDRHAWITLHEAAPAGAPAGSR